VESLRLAIDCLPVATREAMLRGVRGHDRILVGAYVDELGGVCPMLAAHRCGGRTDFLSFAKSWDRFARARGRKRAATRREVELLVGQLESSLAAVSGLELDRAIADHRALLNAGRREARAHAGSTPTHQIARALEDSADPTGPIRARRLRVLRRRQPSGEPASAGARGDAAAPARA
jgi:hypothetical protein